MVSILQTTYSRCAAVVFLKAVITAMLITLSISSCDEFAAGGASHVIGKVHTHPLTGQLVMHWLPTARWESLATVATTKLAPSDAASAKQLLTATVMQALQTSDPGSSTGLATVAMQHTALSFWSGEGTR